MRRPTALQLVGWLFFVSGLWAAVSIAEALFLEQRISLDIEVLGLWIGPGLLRHEARYRTWAMRLLILECCLVLIAALLLIVGAQPLEANVFGHPVANVSRSVAHTTVALLFGATIWQYWVLSQPTVRALFSAPPNEDSEAEQPG